MRNAFVVLGLACLTGCSAVRGVLGGTEAPPPPPPHRAVSEAAVAADPVVAPAELSPVVVSPAPVVVDADTSDAADPKREIRETIRGIQQDLKDGKINAKDAEKRIRSLRKNLERSAGGGGDDLAARVKELAGVADRVESLERRILLLEEKLDEVLRRADAR